MMPVTIHLSSHNPRLDYLPVGNFGAVRSEAVAFGRGEDEGVG